MTHKFPEIGNRLRAYRLGSGQSVGDIATRLGVSRATVFRYERGEVVKIETLARLSSLLQVSLPSLLGVGVEYCSTAVAFFERLRQLEQDADHISVLLGPLSHLLTSDEYDRMLSRALMEMIPRGVKDSVRRRSEVERVLEIIQRRKEEFRRRRPSVLSIVAAREIERFLESGLVGRPPSAELRRARRMMARREVEHMINLIQQPPAGIQIGVVRDAPSPTVFQILRQRDRSVVAISSFRVGFQPNFRMGLAMITSDAEALALHHRLMADLWSDALKGEHATRCLRGLLARVGT